MAAAEQRHLLVHRMHRRVAGHHEDRRAVKWAVAAVCARRWVLIR
jgi:hypothetical protein